MSPATYRFLADALVVVHFAFVVFVVVGALVALRWRWVVALHLPAVAWAVFAMGTNRICPLTPWENQLRTHGGSEAYAGGFVEHYITPVLYPQGLTDHAQTMIALAVLGLNLVCYTAYAFLWRRRRVRRAEASDKDASSLPLPPESAPNQPT